MDIQIDNLTKTYGTQYAVDDISFKVNTGEILGFLGPNGANCLIILYNLASIKSMSISLSTLILGIN